MACYILKQLASDDPARHYWIIVLCTGEIYGGWVVVPLGLMVDSYSHIAKSLRSVQAKERSKKD
ncbi:hypothetical protein PHLCEN_2v5573 [Hermanssonia centrifuga]|uniref:Uncharacterized protein n=1 Tax=Hermanssonia centrifuga TaxID=98765 RepID=A0A2R6P2G4_9APHY|nr:hypothetical protein PHLCEN_2v5573 [Hermanssonia centrifuga]